MNKILVSVVIPVKNGASTIEKCIDTLLSQKLDADLEIIIIDSGSTDGTLELLKKYNVRLLEIPPAAFNHGLTRNFGIGHACGDFVYLTVQDSWQKDNDNLARMLSHFGDPLIAAVCGIQGIPAIPECDPVHWYNPVSEPTVRRSCFPERSSFDALTPQQQLSVCALDNVNAMYRRSSIVQYPFSKADFAEDVAWAKAALQNGLALARDSGAVVYHYHYRDFGYSFKVTFTFHYHVHRIFNLLPAYPAIGKNMMLAAYRLAKNKSIKWTRKFQWFFHGLGDESGAWYATLVFRKAARKKGEQGLTKAYQHFCKTVPQGRLKAQR